MYSAQQGEQLVCNMDSVNDIAHDVLNKEIRGLESLSEVIDDNLYQAIELIIATKGRIVVSGIGKSGYIGKKISASLSSTGTPSIFLHPAEAIHGDLGIVARDDIIIMLSNSGGTNELLPIIDYCKRFNIKIIGICRKKNSMLDKASDISLILPNIAEASDINAPTTSATMMMVYGDIITVCLHRLRCFTKEDFNIFHPGGNIGARLKKVTDFMHINDKVPLVSKNVLAMDAILEMTSKRFGCVGIVDESNMLVGIITDGDLRRNITANFAQVQAVDIMTTSPITIQRIQYATEALKIMEQKYITQLFVTEDTKVVGIIHMHDLLHSNII